MPSIAYSFITRRLGSLVAIAAMFTLAACATGPRVEKASEDLIEVHRGNFDQVFMPRDTSIPRLTRVTVTEPTVEMSEHWRRTHRGDFTSRDLDRIERDYSRFLRDALTETLETRTNIQVVEAHQNPDLIIRPSLLRLNIYAPDLTTRPARARQYIETAGNATLNLELIDTETGRVLAQFIDHRETPPLVAPGRLEATNRATNNRLFIRLMERWSINLVEYLTMEGAVDAG